MLRAFLPGGTREEAKRRGVGRGGRVVDTRLAAGVMLGVVTVLMLSACAQTHLGPTASPPTEERIPVVHADGLADVPIGAARAELERHLNHGLPGCNTQLAQYPQGSLVFTDEGRLVLLWFERPLRTPHGVSTGTPLNEVKKIYPSAQELNAPEGSYQFDGLLVTSGEHGYLFLHDGRTVQKAIAGYVDYLRRLFDTGFGAC
ncbi:hypothetical protein [Allorhizocola rhizosphaerae]|uniref:hypothetical protein n=1 Tax=Allorhizocola rhizosphaerae TaxID=1872709 RepID=UPI000E3CD064|nr:hypothetical protein [Allorhizocola rhizosphaerae]